MPAGTSPDPLAHNLDIRAINKVYESILKVGYVKVVTRLGSTCVRLLKMIEEHMLYRSGGSEKSEGEWLRVILILLLSPLLGEVPASGGELVVEIAGIVARLAEGSRKVRR